MRLVLAVFFSLIPLFATAQPSMFAGYDAFCGLPVIVESTPQHAVATIRNNVRIIIVDPSVMSNWRLSRMFSLAHECGHHQLGHLSPQEMFSRAHMNATPRQEMHADCWATRALAANGRYDEIERAIRDNDREGPMMNGAYPSGMTRASYIRECAAGTRSGTESDSAAEDSEDGDSGDEGTTNTAPTPQCLAEMNQRCMTSCQGHFGYSYSVCKNRMCNAPRQLESNISRCNARN
jgi:hypothetical protein